MESDRRVSAFYEGIALFNQGRFFECHETWEIAWKDGEGSERILLQGLIQAAVALLHVERGNLRGARLVYAKARARLDPLPLVMRGLDLDSFRIALADYFASAPSGYPPQLLPLLRLRS
jgi:predicted metal-dependent hydrolase